MSRLDNFEGFIFDLDGTIVDSNGVWTKIDEIILRKYNIRGIKAAECASMDYDEFHQVLTSNGVDCTLEQLKAQLDDMALKEYRYNIFLKPGVKEYLDILTKTGKKIALATASPKRLYEPVLRNNCVYNYFDAFITTDEAGAGKDYPDIYLMAAEKLEVFPERCIVFEDVMRGIVSARNAGMYTAAVYDKYSKDDIITMRSMADIFVMSFEDMPLINS